MQAEKQTQKWIGKIFNEIADALETGQYGAKPRIGVTAIGSEHGETNIFDAAQTVKEKGIEPIVIGNKANDTTISTIQAATEEEAHHAMEKLIAEETIDAAVTMHYPFPIGVSTVGRIITPGKGKQVYIATTTGTSSTDRIEGMVKNAIYGIITAKACGVKNPSVGILNIEGARQTEIALKKLQENGYDIPFASSQRADGGVVMRGNDLLMGAADVMVADPLTGNLMMKIFSAYTTGGNYESLGYGYGPGIGEGYDKLILIISRASGVPVIAGAIEYAAQLIRGNYKQIAEQEFTKANQAGLKKILAEIKAGKKENLTVQETQAPAKEIVTAQIAGIEIMDLEDAVQKLWGAGIYAESGMGCTGPIVLVAEHNMEKAMKILTETGYIA